MSDRSTRFFCYLSSPTRCKLHGSRKDVRSVHCWLPSSQKSTPDVHMWFWINPDLMDAYCSCMAHWISTKSGRSSRNLARTTAPCSQQTQSAMCAKVGWVGMFHAPLPFHQETSAWHPCPDQVIDSKAVTVFVQLFPPNLHSPGQCGHIADGLYTWRVNERMMSNRHIGWQRLLLQKVLESTQMPWDPPSPPSHPRKGKRSTPDTSSHMSKVTKQATGETLRLEVPGLYSNQRQGDVL